MEWEPWLVTFIAGQATGLGIALGIARVERRWRRQEVRAAEKRARLEERFEPVRGYAGALYEFVNEAAGWMRVWEGAKPGEDWEGFADFIRARLEEQWDKLEDLKPRPAPRFVVRDCFTQGLLQGLELLATKCQSTCVLCLRDGTVADAEELRGRVAEAEENLGKLLERMEDMVEKLE